jgi:hypothetical protein
MSDKFPFGLDETQKLPPVEHVRELFPARGGRVDLAPRFSFDDFNRLCLHSGVISCLNASKKSSAAAPISATITMIYKSNKAAAQVDDSRDGFGFLCTGLGF